MQREASTLVLGGTGKTGRRLVQRLMAAEVGDGVQQVLGRPARDFTAYARDTAATGIWSREDVA
ncbi:hypothetical protein [Nocardioides sp. YIM 152315]|uniref:hypothetical protein n=1 Tax=Nocardioides sp. YIM 152315 TaxID=3031760 RepID=UPI0023DC1C17|nr:hypothetical protein [Nocardioides sp. YIM 152315]MDF1604529.1 hypothetical protein [Nocardioides sp. YIM 152315]